MQKLLRKSLSSYEDFEILLQSWLSNRLEGINMDFYYAEHSNNDCFQVSSRLQKCYFRLECCLRVSLSLLRALI